MFDQLRKIYQDLRTQDPLLQRGIEPDWVCVVSPRMEYHLLDTFPERYPFYPHRHGIKALDNITGRLTFVLNNAFYEMEYLSPDQFAQKYPEAYAEWQKAVHNDPS